MTQVPSNSELMASLQKSLIVIQKLKKELAKSREPIAIIGIHIQLQVLGETNENTDKVIYKIGTLQQMII